MLEATEKCQTEQISGALTDEERFQLLVNAVTDYAIYMLDASGNVASWNAGAERFKGYTASEIIGRHFSTFYTEEDIQRGVPVTALETSARTGKFEAEGWRVRKDGRRFWAHVIIDPIRSPSGVLLGFAKVTRDLTERREAQEALLQSQKMEAIGQLTGGLAHDFNNLLTAVLGSLELVQRRIGNDSRIAPLVENAVQAAQRGANLTQRMLAFARRQHLNPVPVAIPDLVNGMTDMLDRSLGANIRLAVRFSPGMSTVLVDRNQLEMAVLNLAVNARDAMPRGGVINIEAHEQELAETNAFALPAGRYAVLSITDRGEGMDETTLLRAREPFFTTKGVGKGTGLGLSMVHSMAEQSGGRLVLKSKRGEGTTATLWFPALSAAASSAYPETCHDNSPLALSKPLAVLVVEDDALVVLNTAAMLEDQGHRVTTAYSGKEALQILRSGEAFDLLITDQGMPGMTGAELIETVRAERPDLAIVLATAYDELPAAVARGVPRLLKPFMQAQLLQSVKEAVSRGN
jgi:PAS domain S-box-containing protein